MWLWESCIPGKQTLRQLYILSYIQPQALDEFLLIESLIFMIFETEDKFMGYIASTFKTNSALWGHFWKCHHRARRLLTSALCFRVSSVVFFLNSYLCWLCLSCRRKVALLPCALLEVRGQCWGCGSLLSPVCGFWDQSPLTVPSQQLHSPADPAHCGPYCWALNLTIGLFYQCFGLSQTLGVNSMYCTMLLWIITLSSENNAYSSVPTRLATL